MIVEMQNFPKTDEPATMVERVKDRLKREFPFAWPSIRFPPSRPEYDFDHVMECLARAAIEAMREPTEEMKDAGCKAALEGFYGLPAAPSRDSIRRRVTETSYAAMIDFILSPKDKQP